MPAVPLDPRTPVLVGVGQITHRTEQNPVPSVRMPALAEPLDLPALAEPLDLPALAEPLDLMEAAVRSAIVDCGGAGAGTRLVARTGSLQVVRPLSWHYVNAAAPLAQRLGIAPRQLAQSAIGGNSPQAMASAAAAAITAGQVDVLILTGAECLAARMQHRRANGGAEPPWTVQSPATPAPVALAVDRDPVTDEERRSGLIQPIHVYPLFEEAIRAGSGRNRQEHLQVVTGLWSRFSEVAAANPLAWDRHGWRADELATVRPDNRMIATPYTKRLVAYDRVNQGAALILCSVAAARAAGVPEDRWVFPIAGADGHDHWFLTERLDLGRSPAMAAAGSRALSLAGFGVDDVAHVDLYSCFPCAVQMGASALGIGLDEPDRPLTVTGGLTFFGGPINTYATNAIATMADRLRHHPGSLGLVTALGWYATKHAVGLWSTTPPAAGFRWEDVQPTIDAQPRRRAASDHVGAVTVETATVVYDRQGQPERAIAALRTADGRRTWGTSTDPDMLAELAVVERYGQPARIDTDRQVFLD